MSTSDDLSKATAKLSLSPSASSFDFSKPFTLVSADGHSFSVDPLKLAGTSGVFADMLSSGGGERTCTLSENKEEVEAYLAAVQSGTFSVDEATWLGVFKMSDKYEALVVRTALHNAASVWLSDSMPVPTYAAATLLDSRVLAESAALPALAALEDLSQQAQDNILYLQIPQVSRLLLEKYGLVRILAQRTFLLQSHAPACPQRSASCSPCNLPPPDKLWAQAIRYAAKDVSAQVDVPIALAQGLAAIAHEWPSCAHCSETLLSHAAFLMEEWETGPDGKHSVKLFD
ncbi:hypothetical protein JCM6882_004092 [Rhodosporidiobolus microsporus]